MSPTQISRPPSVFSATSADTFVAEPPYRGYPSKDAYLAALREWVESKAHYETGTQVMGFYGTKTAEDVKLKADEYKRKARRENGRERPGIRELNSVPEESVAGAELSKTERFKKMFGRRRTVA